MYTNKCGKYDVLFMRNYVVLQIVSLWNRIYYYARMWARKHAL